MSERELALLQRRQMTAQINDLLALVLYAIAEARRG